MAGNLDNSPQNQEYTAKRVSVALTLRRYFNECLPIMAKEEVGELTMEEAMDKFDELDALFAKHIVDELSPKKSIIQL